jgi:hypothetical protein
LIIGGFLYAAAMVNWPLYIVRERLNFEDEADRQ